jgi:hypothetical protein
MLREKMLYLKNAHCKKKLAIFLSPAGMSLAFFTVQLVKICRMCVSVSVSVRVRVCCIGKVLCENMLCLKFLILISNFLSWFKVLSRLNKNSSNLLIFWQAACIETFLPTAKVVFRAIWETPNRLPNKKIIVPAFFGD